MKFANPTAESKSLSHQENGHDCKKRQVTGWSRHPCASARTKRIDIFERFVVLVFGIDARTLGAEAAARNHSTEIICLGLCIHVGQRCAARARVFAVDDALVVSTPIAFCRLVLGFFIRPPENTARAILARIDSARAGQFWVTHGRIHSNTVSSGVRGSSATHCLCTSKSVTACALTGRARAEAG